MIRFFDPKTKTEKAIPVDKFLLGFSDPDTGEVRKVPIVEIVEGNIGDYKFITSHPYVYSRQNGYISIGGEKDLLVRKLEPDEIALIEQALKIKNGTASNAEETAIAKTRLG